MAGLPTPGERGALSRFRRAWPIVRFALGIALGALALYVLNGQRGELTGATSYLDDIRWPAVILAIVLEAGAIVSFAILQVVLLRAGGADRPLGRLVLITLAGNAINNSLPAGPAFASVFAFQQYKRCRADDTLAAWTVLAVAILAGAALAVVAAVGLAISGAEGSSLNLVGVTLLTLLVIGAIGAAVLVVLWRRRALRALLVRLVRLSQRFAHRPAGDAIEVAARVIARVTAVRPSARGFAVAFSYAAGNWVFDCGCLAASFLAVGAGVPWRGLLLAYGAGQLAANLPITPGGLGVVEGSLTIALVAYGGAEAVTVAAVLLYRIINFWGSLPVGWLAWGWLGLRERAIRHRRAEAEPEAVAA